MARVGPNQDINDGTTLEDLRKVAEETSVWANDHDEANSAITSIKATGIRVSPVNDRLIPISTLLQKQDGSSLAIDGFTTSGTFVQSNLDEYEDAVINTYIDQAERFRGYYDSLVASARSWSPRSNGSISAITFSGVPIGVESGSLNEGAITTNINYTQKDGYVGIIQSRIPSSIDWSGSGPVNYNSGTYTQLINEFTSLARTLSFSDSTKYADVASLLSQGLYSSADAVDGMRKTLEMWERAEWNDQIQRFAQVSERFPSPMDSAIPFVAGHQIRIPLFTINFTDTDQFPTYNIKITMTPRNETNRIFEAGYTGFVYKVISNSPDSQFELLNFPAADVDDINDLLTSPITSTANRTIFSPANSINVGSVLVGFINQVEVFAPGGSFTGWDTEDLMSDINIQISLDGHSMDQDFDVGLVRSLWP